MEPRQHLMLQDSVLVQEGGAAGRVTQSMGQRATEQFNAEVLADLFD
jgi:hypothetical protein